MKKKYQSHPRGSVFEYQFDASAIVDQEMKSKITEVAVSYSDALAVLKENWKLN